MGLEDVPRCQHVKVNGVQCGSPALRRRRRCYFHEGIRIERDKFVADQFALRRFELPPLEDANAVQLGLMKVIQWLGSGRLEPKIAGLILYALQTASSNLKQTNFGAAKPTDVVIDRTMDRTCINGPQWYESEFDTPKDIAASAPLVAEEGNSRELAADALKFTAPKSDSRRPIETRRQRRARARAQLRKRPRPVPIAPGESPTLDLINKIFGTEAQPNGLLAMEELSVSDPM